MANYTTNLKDWGATGQEYPNGYNYQEDVPPVDLYDNFLTNNLINDIQHLIDTTNTRIESESGAAGGEPTSPETIHLYGDEGNNRLRLWDSSTSSWHDLMFRDGDTMTGPLNMGGYSITNIAKLTDENGNTIFDTSGKVDFGNSDRLNIPERTTDPAGADVADIWYRTDLD